MTICSQELLDLREDVMFGFRLHLLDLRQGHVIFGLHLHPFGLSPLEA